MKLLVSELAKVVKAENDWQQWADVVVEHVEFDTRKIVKNSLFVPLQGGNRDGHEFLEVAIESGASVSLWQKEVAPARANFPILVVEDTLIAMQKIAMYFLSVVQPKVIGITGSNGKTTTKDMVASVLGQQFETYKTQGNYNNHIGLPYTILSMPMTTEMLVLEMGMDHFGEIEVLSQIAQPDVAAITMIGESHMEFLGSRAGIAKAKMEIVSGLKAGGLLVVPGEEPLLKPLLEQVSQKVLTFGPSQKNNLSAQITAETKVETTFNVPNYQNSQFVIPVLGQYNVNNALIALAIGSYFEMEIGKMATGLAELDLTKSRTEWLVAANGAEILSDVYNANPTAMSLVLDTFSQLPSSGRKYAVLADMGELGDSSQSLHEKMAEHLDPEKIQEVFLFGPQMKVLFEKLSLKYPKGQVSHYDLDAKGELITKVLEGLQSTDMIVLKGSNSMKLIEIVEKLTENKS